MSSLKVATITDTSGGNTATINSMTPTADSLQGFRNRIINGAMVIDQRNAGAAVTIDGTNGTYTLDRWAGHDATDGAFTFQRSTTAPAGYINSLLVTVTTADASLAATQRSFIYQNIEGLNCADLGWGTASAATVTLSFWVRSSLTGTFGGSLYNSAEDRSYPFTYTISAANTFEQKSVTIAGDTTGTWLTTNGIGITVGFNLGTGSTYTGTAGAWAATRYYSATGATSVIGTLGATFYITGVQLEVGSVATPFERRPYGAELALCQRYYWKITGSTNVPFGSGFNESTTSGQSITFFPVEMRTAPTALEQSGTASNYRIRHAATDTNLSAVPVFQNASNWLAWTSGTVASGLTAGQGSFLRSNNASAYLAWSAEL